MVECTMQETAKEDPKLLKLLLHADNVKGRLLNVIRSADCVYYSACFCQPLVVEKLVSWLVRRIHKSSVGNECSFECMPDNMDAVESGGVDGKAVGSYMSRKAADCRDWNPEIPEFVGIFHAYVKGFNKDARTHKLFLVVSG